MSSTRTNDDLFVGDESSFSSFGTQREETTNIHVVITTKQRQVFVSFFLRLAGQYLYKNKGGSSSFLNTYVQNDDKNGMWRGIYFNLLERPFSMTAKYMSSFRRFVFFTDRDRHVTCMSVMLTVIRTVWCRIAKLPCRRNNSHRGRVILARVSHMFPDWP
jgi:hypothetical protein